MRIYTLGALPFGNRLSIIGVHIRIIERGIIKGIHGRRNVAIGLIALERRRSVAIENIVEIGRGNIGIGLIVGIGRRNIDIGLIVGIARSNGCYWRRNRNRRRNKGAIGRNSHRRIDWLTSWGSRIIIRSIIRSSRNTRNNRIRSRNTRNTRSRSRKNSRSTRVVTLSKSSL